MTTENNNANVEVTQNEVKAQTPVDKVQSVVGSTLFKKAAMLSVAAFVVYQANPFGIFDSEEIKKANRVIKTKNEIVSMVGDKESIKGVYSDKVSANNESITELEKAKKDAELNICGLEKQYGKETVDFTLKCDDKEYAEYVKSKVSVAGKKQG